MIFFRSSTNASNSEPAAELESFAFAQKTNQKANNKNPTQEPLPTPQTKKKKNKKRQVWLAIP